MARPLPATPWNPGSLVSCLPPPAVCLHTPHLPRIPLTARDKDPHITHRTHTHTYMYMVIGDIYLMTALGVLLSQVCDIDDNMTGCVTFNRLKVRQTHNYICLYFSCELSLRELNCNHLLLWHLQAETETYMYILNVQHWWQCNGSVTVNLFQD